MKQVSSDACDSLAEASISEGRMKELSMDLRDPNMSDQKFAKHYGMTRAQARTRFSGNPQAEPDSGARRSSTPTTQTGNKSMKEEREQDDLDDPGRDYVPGSNDDYEDDLPFEPNTNTSDKDEFGNTIKHKARHLAKKGLRQARRADNMREGVAEGVEQDSFLQRVDSQLQRAGYTKQKTGKSMIWTQGPEGRYVDLTPLPDGRFGWELRRVDRHGRWHSGVDTARDLAVIFKEFDIFSRHEIWEGNLSKQGIAEGADKSDTSHVASARARNRLGNMIEKYYGKIYNYGDDAVEYLEENAPTWFDLDDQYDGDLDAILRLAPLDLLARAAQEVKDVANELPHAMYEGGMEEGNDFTGARQAAIRAGKPTFSIGGKTYRVTGNTTDEKVMEKKEKVLWPGTPEYKKKFPANMRTGEKTRTHTGGELEKTDTGVRHTARARDDDDDTATADKSGAPRKRGRPPGSKRAIGAKGPTGRSKLLKGRAIREMDMEDENDLDYDFHQDNLDPTDSDQEGEMAKSQSRTIVDAAEELQSMLGDDDNLPEWVQKKIALAQEYIDSARDYLKANRPESDGEEQPVVAEKFASRAQARLMHATAGGADTGVSKKTAREFVKKSHGQKVGDLPEKVSKNKEKPVKETTTSGAVATAPAEAPKSKKGMVFGKGVYEGQLAESFNTRLNEILSEGMSMSMNVSEDGQKSLTVSATDEDAEKLAEILKLAGLESQPSGCDSCGQTPCGCEDLGEGEYANSPEPVQADTNTLVNSYSGGLNDSNTTGQTTTPVIAGQTQRMTSQVREEAESRLWNLWTRYTK